MLRSAVSAFTRVFDALCFAAWCRGPSRRRQAWVPALPRTAEEALHRVRDTPYFSMKRPDVIRDRCPTGQL
jgi:hypothetical protein